MYKALLKQDVPDKEKDAKDLSMGCVGRRHKVLLFIFGAILVFLVTFVSASFFEGPYLVEVGTPGDDMPTGMRSLPIE